VLKWCDGRLWAFEAATPRVESMPDLYAGISVLSFIDTVTNSVLEALEKRWRWRFGSAHRRA